MTTASPPQLAASLAGPAFDHAAAGYDATFTNTALGRLLRRRVWRTLDRASGAGERVLELGCGTGEDATHLASRGVAVLATDGSPRMLEVARSRLDARGASDLASLDRVDLGAPGDLARLRELGPFDGAFSDFGAVNALRDRRPLAEAVAHTLGPGSPFVLVVMGPFCPWEVAWHVLHGEPSVAVRRWRRGAVARVGGSGRMRVWYPSPATLRRELEPWFRLVALVGLGVALPPSGLAGLVEDRPRLLATLAAIEERAARVPASAWIADHYVAEFERA